MSVTKNISEEIKCYHCGDLCKDNSITLDNKVFCCNGCKTVYQILNESKLSNYYKIDSAPGVSPEKFHSSKFDYLEDSEIINKLIDYSDDELKIVTFSIPQMHCSSCIWLLENLYKLNSGVISSEVNFLKKQLTVRFSPKKIKLKVLVELLSTIGYEPNIQLDSIEQKSEKPTNSNKNIYYKIGIAGFCFGNIMLFSFPEYLSIDIHDFFFKNLFAYLNLILALPVIFYSASEYFISAYKGLRKKVVNIDVPISLGIIVLFSRSLVEILTHTGAGYFDSLTGLVFFLLIGKLFQQKTYDSLNFERSYKSYFPLAVTIKKNNKEKSVAVSNLKTGDRMIIRNKEIIPADSILFSGSGNIDYSFVTGESKPVQKVMGELIYAGGRQIGSALELEVVKEVSQSYLTRLWNSENFGKKVESSFTTFSNKVSKYFTIVVLFIAFVSALFWLPVSVHTSLNVLTAVLIVACPCALALSIPFTMGNMLRIFGKHKFYLKSTRAIEELAKINTIVFDKTGTITETGKANIEFVGKPLDDFQKELVKSIVRNSNHPLSKQIYEDLDTEQVFDVISFDEFHGEGIEGKILDKKIKLGSGSFVVDGKNISFNNSEIHKDKIDTRVYLSINNEVLGYFKISNYYREGLSKVFKSLKKEFKLSLLSGDNEGEKKNLLKYFNDETKLFFNQSPEDKLNYITNLQNSGSKVLMIGDGLNDAGALSKSDIGIAVTENTNNFSPACDAILDASMLKKIATFISLSKTSVRIIYISYAISFIYNIVGLTFAVGGMLSPIVAAILMPLSSISVVAFATFAVNFSAGRKGL